MERFLRAHGCCDQHNRASMRLWLCHEVCVCCSRALPVWNLKAGDGLSAARRRQIGAAFLRFSGRLLTANTLPRRQVMAGKHRAEYRVRINAALCLFAIAAAHGTVANSSSALAEPENGLAAVYSRESGHETASGQTLNPEAFTAAHRTLPFGTSVKVTNKQMDAR
jgi:hypothetical protein